MIKLCFSSKKDLYLMPFFPRQKNNCSLMPALLLIVILLSASPALAADTLASYPPLPSGYSSIKVFDSQRRFVGRILPEKRYWVTIDRIPAFLQRAVVAVEDARFYEHGGIDVRGIARALMKDVIKGRLAEGGSTITQQLMKNKFLTAEVSLDRKVKEARLAMEFEKTHTKQQILEMYFNEIYYGNGIVGLAQAAKFYFNKGAEDLTGSECVLLAGVPKNPGRYNPMGKPADVIARREVVLKRMVELKYITALQSQDLRAKPVAVPAPGVATHYLAYLRTRLVERFGPQVIEQGGLEVIAALDLNLQKQAEQALRDGVKRLAPGLEGALVCLDPVTGDVLAAVGGAEATSNALNRAFVSKRQPGSSIKPLIYATALEQGITAGSLWSDTPVAYRWGNGQVWKPLNYGKEQFGEQSLRQALAHSNNVITVKVLEKIGVPALVTYAGKVGLPLRSQNGLSLALGTDEVTLKDLVEAYTPLATGGTWAQARVILRIYDRRRGTWTEEPPVVAPVLDPAAAFITTSMLQDVLAYGTGKTLKGFSLLHPAAGKTGTTDAYMDAWFIGYTPQLITGIWVGYDQPRSGGRGFTGGTVAAPIWERFMTKALASTPPSPFPKPDSVVTARIDPATGYLAREDCPTSQEEFYRPGTEPTEFCPKHGAVPPLGLE